MKKLAANLITGCRILCSILLLLFVPFSVPFYAAYLICGISDMVDGAVARILGSTSPFGARLDTVADVMFALAALVKLLPRIPLARWMRIWVAALAIIKLANIVASLLRKKAPAAIHTVLNKITGLLLFLLPLSLGYIELKYTSVLVCSVATVSAVQEGYLIGSGRAIVS